MTALRQRAPLLLILVVGLLAWRGGFGFFPFERTVVLRLPTAYADVRSIEVQIWNAEGLLKRQITDTPQGLQDDPRVQIALRRGEHRAFALTTGLRSDGGSWQVTFDPGWDEVVTLDVGR